MAAANSYARRGRRCGSASFRGRGLPQEAAADRAGLTRIEVSLLERGLRTPRLDTIVRLGGALEIEPCGLLMGMAIQLDPPRKGGSK